MSHFRTILFDADNTLFDFRACEKEALRLTFLKNGYRLEWEAAETYERINLDLWAQFEKGLIDRHTVIYSRFGLLFRELGIDNDGISFEDDYQELLGMQHFLIGDALEVIEKLSGEFDLYIVTNGVTATQLRRLEESGLDSFMKKIFVSEETGYQKPMKEYFDYCFERIENFKPEEAIIIGDSLSSDIKGGNNAGIATCWFNPDGQINDTNARVDYEIHSLKELYGLLGYGQEFIISGYGAKPVNTLALYTLTGGEAKAIWSDSVENASFVCQGDGYLFTVTEVSDYAVIYLYQRQGKAYRLSDQKRIEGGALCHIAYSSRNKALFGACYETGTLFSVRVEAGRFGELLFHEVQSGNHPAALTRTHCVVLNEEETQLIVINIALDRCYFYTAWQGCLTLESILEVPKGVGPRHVLLSGDESLLYIITEYSNEILVYENKDGKRLIQRISTLSESFAGTSNCSTLCFSKDGRYLYAANRGAETIALFEVREDGTLGYQKEFDCGGKHPRHMILTKDGRYLIVCNQNSDNVSVYLLDQAEGALKSRITSISFPAPSGILEL